MQFIHGTSSNNRQLIITFFLTKKMQWNQNKLLSTYSLLDIVYSLASKQPAVLFFLTAFNPLKSYKANIVYIFL